ncbi:putative ATP-dependent RNA helicase ddx4 [Branchiostoma belcheri]|nr:putative ATP-dependent RNA helicase ddx4 [Branchiostoma belcheri]
MEDWDEGESSTPSFASSAPSSGFGRGNPSGREGALSRWRGRVVAAAVRIEPMAQVVLEVEGVVVLALVEGVVDSALVVEGVDLAPKEGLGVETVAVALDQGVAAVEARGASNVEKMATFPESVPMLVGAGEGEEEVVPASSVERKDTCPGSAPVQALGEEVVLASSVEKRATCPGSAPVQGQEEEAVLATSVEKRATWPETVQVQVQEVVDLVPKVEVSGPRMEMPSLVVVDLAVGADSVDQTTTTTALLEAALVVGRLVDLGAAVEVEGLEVVEEDLEVAVVETTKERKEVVVVSSVVKMATLQGSAPTQKEVVVEEEGHISRECPNAEAQPLDPDRPAPVTYVPPPPPEGEEEIFQTIAKGINFDKYDEIPVEVTGRECPRHIGSFDEAQLYETFRANVAKAKYDRPTPVQKYSIPIILNGRDLMACAQTGSGKTAAFLLPVLTGMMQEGLTGSQFSGVQEPQAICVAPTRELAIQIHCEARKFSYGTMLRPCIAYGGVSVMHHKSQIQRGCHFLVATPGRLLDFIDKGVISIKKLKYLILDEADRMLDMGFEPEIRRLVETASWGMPAKGERQTLMFSATFPEEIQKLAQDFLEDYIFLTIGRVGGANTDVEQSVMESSQYDKREKLTDILGNLGQERVLVFVETKRNADFLASYLSQSGFPTTSIHGDRLQKEREEALSDFRQGRAPVLVATSVAARGLDIPKVMVVINYDLPSSIDEYVHRIGRTGRVGNTGKAISFYDSDKDASLARSLVKVLADAQQEVPEWLEEAAEGAIGTNYGPAGGSFGSRDTRKQFNGGGASCGMTTRKTGARYSKSLPPSLAWMPGCFQGLHGSGVLL